MRRLALSPAFAGTLTMAVGWAPAGCDPPPEAGAVTDAGGSSVEAGAPPPNTTASYAIVVLPDTQYYASSWTEIFDAQVRWIADNREVQRIAFDARGAFEFTLSTMRADRYEIRSTLYT